MALTDSLISCWELEAASGTRNDATANANHLTDNNTVTQNTGKVANCAQFVDANLEFLSRASNSTLATGDIDFTVAIWAYIDAFAGLSFPVLIQKGAAPDYEYQIFQDTGNNGEIGFYVEGAASSGTVYFTHSAPSLATWYYVIVWHDSVNNLIGMSIDNGTAVTQAYSGGAKSTANAFQIGADTLGASGFSGRLDQACFWKRVLTSGDRTALYNSGNGLSYAAMVAASTDSPAVSDTITFSETVTVKIPILVPRVSDVISITEIKTVALPPPGTRLVSANASIAITETVTVKIAFLLVSVSDAITLSEIITFSETGNLNLRKRIRRNRRLLEVLELV